jgi:hypothetical protein
MERSILEYFLHGLWTAIVFTWHIVVFLAACKILQRIE